MSKKQGDPEIIDGVWAFIDSMEPGKLGEYTIYESEVKTWAREYGERCPKCGASRGVKNIREDHGVKRGNCESCNANLTIILGK
jgi:hypothetical protein